MSVCLLSREKLLKDFSVYKTVFVTKCVTHIRLLRKKLGMAQNNLILKRLGWGQYLLRMYLICPWDLSMVKNSQILICHPIVNMSLFPSFFK